MKTEKIFYERLDKVFDALRIKNLKINDEQFNRYTNFSRTYLDKLEEFVNKLNELRYLWVQIDDNVVKINIKKIYFDSTYQYHEHTDDFTDVYTIKYENDFTETISTLELLQILRKGAIKRKKGIIGLNKENVSYLSQLYAS